MNILSHSGRRRLGLGKVRRQLYEMGFFFHQKFNFFTWLLPQFSLHNQYCRKKTKIALNKSTRSRRKRVSLAFVVGFRTPISALPPFWLIIQLNRSLSLITAFATVIAHREDNSKSHLLTFLHLRNSCLQQGRHRTKNFWEFWFFHWNYRSKCWKKHIY